MLQRETTIINKLGLHARASAKLVSTASRFISKIDIEHGGQSADAKSIMAVMMLAASKGSQLVLRCEGEDEQHAITVIGDLIDSGFEEEE